MRTVYILICSLILYSNSNYIEFIYIEKNKYTVFDDIFINVVKIKVEIFEKYNNFMQNNNIYFIVSVFDFWIKTQWIKNHISDTNSIIKQIYDFLKFIYFFKFFLFLNTENNEYKNFKYWFLESYQSFVKNTFEISDINQYFDNSQIAYKNKSKKNQTK